ncbi:MAG: TPM domain-containing protein [Archangium sp.]
MLLSLILAAAIPVIDSPVVDEAKVLTDAGKEAIAAKLREHQQKTGVQIAVVTVDSTDGEAIESWSMRAATEWGGGSKRIDDGALFVLAVMDRKMRIELGYGLEGNVSDGEAENILARARSGLRDGDFDGAVGGVIDELIAATVGGAVSAEERARILKAQEDARPLIPPEFRKLIFFAGVLLIFGILGRVAKSRRKSGELSLMGTLIVFAVLVIATEFAFGLAGEGWIFGWAALFGAIAGNTFFLSEWAVTFMYPVFMMMFCNISAALMGGGDPELEITIRMGVGLFVTLFFTAFSTDSDISFGSSGSSWASRGTDDDNDNSIFSSTRRSSSSSFGSSSWGSSSSSSSSSSSRSSGSSGGYSGGGGSFGGGGASSSW